MSKISAIMYAHIKREAKEAKETREENTYDVKKVA